MKAAQQDSSDPAEKRGHICPLSNATHPRDRWESLFVYGFICKFTPLRGKVDGLDSPMDFENALLLPEPNPIMTQILSRFVLNLRPHTRNVSSDVISSTVTGVLQEYFKTSERTIFWDDELRKNVDPFYEMPDGFFAATWDMKLKILRQLVELQLCHSPALKAIIDRAWGVVHNKHKKNETTPAPPPPSDPNSRENLQLIPLGQDKERKRYWAVDDSPRLYLSTNPWKITATFQAISSTREEYVATVDKIRETAPSETKPGERRGKLDQAHLALLQVLQDKLERIDAELARIQRARRKIEQRNLLIAQAEVRETRTRKRTSRPNYAYMNDPISEDDQDDYTFQDQDDEEYEDQMEFDDLGTYRPNDTDNSRRTSARQRPARTANGNGNDSEWSHWRGERRSTRLGAPTETQLDKPRARTVDSVGSTNSSGTPATTGAQNGVKTKRPGAAAIKPTETAVDAVPGKKKSKFWYYAVEPVPTAPAPPTSVSDNASMIYDRAGSSGTAGSRYQESEISEGNGHDNGDARMSRSPSPASVMDES